MSLDFMCAPRQEMLTGLQALSGSFAADTMAAFKIYTYIVLVIME